MPTKHPFNLASESTEELADYANVRIPMDVGGSDIEDPPTHTRGVTPQQVVNLAPTLRPLFAVTGADSLESVPTALNVDLGEFATLTGNLAFTVVDSAPHMWQLQARGGRTADGANLVQPSDYHISANDRLWVVLW